MKTVFKLSATSVALILLIVGTVIPACAETSGVTLINRSTKCVANLQVVLYSATLAVGTAAPGNSVTYPININACPIRIFGSWDQSSPMGFCAIGIDNGSWKYIDTQNYNPVCAGVTFEVTDRINNILSYPSITRTQ